MMRLMAEELGLGINDSEFEAAQAWSKRPARLPSNGVLRIPSNLTFMTLLPWRRMPVYPKQTIPTSNRSN
ncbi:hypothetical protein DFH08DRAFT_129496 [Mycena albidolilacea]|uniref:Uncharacterized protein n=1 Tax=Mycena albidolilacea TaxID=1033008 RepID=A0AAD7E6F5_9AGAR|nr:hypothetical protein DFH08DRAFT_129496 [Mycena albidolilacea]